MWEKSVDPSPTKVRCWYSFAGLYVKICDMCICDTVFKSIICMCFRMILRCDYICNKWFFICFRIIIFDIIEWVCEKSNTYALLDFILLCIVYNCLLDVWLTPLITIFKLKFSWRIEPLDYFVKCKVKCGSF